MAFGKRLLYRIGQIVLTVWLAVTISFFALAIVPGDPVSVRVGPLASITAEQKANLLTELGLDKPLWQQYLHHLAALIRADFGYSYHQRLEVVEIICRGFVPTAQLAFMALIFVLLLLFTGQIFKRTGASWQNVASVRGRFLTFIHVLATSIPSYWIAFLLLIIFAFKLAWFPAGGSGSVKSIILPAIALAIPIAGLSAQVLDAELDSKLQTPFALSSRARGMSVFDFTLRHASVHTVPALGALTVNILGSLLGGAIMVETVFARPGLGSVALAAVMQRDMPVVLGLIVFSALIFAVLGQLLDELILLVDPRLRRSL